MARSPLPPGLLGRYKAGDKYLLISEELRGTLEYAVTVHEMTHYLQWKRRAWRRGKSASCLREKEAFDASNSVVARLRKPELLIDWDAQRRLYGCPI